MVLSKGLPDGLEPPPNKLERLEMEANVPLSDFIEKVKPAL
jgi:hypothetical protein